MQYLPEGSLIDTKKNRDALASLPALKNAWAAKTVLEERAVVFDVHKNLIVNLGPIRGIIPYAECAVGIAEGATRDISVISRVGKPVCFTVTGFDTSGERPVAMLSRRAVQQSCLTNYVAALAAGDIIDCRVTHIEQFGCFMDVGCGISALLPIDAISVSRIAHPADRINPGEGLRCVVRSRDADGRLLLSHKELLGTWLQNAALFRAGETVSGVVRSVESYGVFVELTPNLAGLSDPFEGAKVGQQASVYIKSIIPEKMKIKLVIIDTFSPAGQPAPFEYFISAGHIDRFTYSPPGCPKVIESLFSA